MTTTYYLNPQVKLELANNAGSAKRQFLLSTGERHYYVDAAIGNIVAAMQNNQDSDHIFENISQKFNVSRETYNELLDVKLLEMGVLIPSPSAGPVQQTSSNPESITFLFHLMPRSLAGQLASGAAVMFTRQMAIAVFVLMLALLIAAFNLGGLSYVNLESLIAAPASLSAAQYGKLYLILFVASVIHELGHLAAAKRFDCEIDRISFGVYLIFPVFYVNMTNTWKLSAAQRIVVSMGGLYFQSLFTVGLLLLAQFTSSPVLMYSVYASIYIILANLNPFLKFDGYWVYADYFDIINLRKAHLTLLGRFMRASPANWIAMYRDAWKSNAGLAAYLVGGTAFLAYFGYLLVSLLVEFLKTLPGNLMSLFDAMPHSFTIWTDMDIVVHISYQFFLLFAFLLIARRSILLCVSAWQYGRSEASPA